MEHLDIKRHFYLVTIEVTSDNKLNNLDGIISPFGAVKCYESDNGDYADKDEQGNYWSHSVSTGEADCIYYEDPDENSGIEKGGKKTIKIGIIADEDILDNTYAEIGVADSYTMNCDDNVIYRDITTYCIKLFE